VAYDPLEPRRQELERLTTTADGARPDLETRQALTALWKTTSLDTVEIRSGFARRVVPLDPSEIGNQRIVDRPRPDLPRRPPLSNLTSLTKGVALRTGLTLLFVAQSDPTTLDAKNGRLRLPIVERNASHPALAELVAVDAQFGSAPDSDLAADRISNRDRQIKSALIALSKTGVGLTRLPDRSRGKDGYSDVRLYVEEELARPVRYAVPDPNADTITVPAEFFLNGWIHVLTSSEIAMWFMLRDLTAREKRADPSHNGWVRINATDRLLRYDLTRSTWDSHHRLADFGLLEVTKDDRRRADGTVKGGKAQSSVPNYFRLNDQGLTEVGMTVVKGALLPPSDGTTPTPAS